MGVLESAAQANMGIRAAGGLDPGAGLFHSSEILTACHPPDTWPCLCILLHDQQICHSHTGIPRGTPLQDLKVTADSIRRKSSVPSQPYLALTALKVRVHDLEITADSLCKKFSNPQPALSCPDCF